MNITIIGIDPGASGALSYTNSKKRNKCKISKMSRINSP